MALNASSGRMEAIETAAPPMMSNQRTINNEFTSSTGAPPGYDADTEKGRTTVTSFEKYRKGNRIDADKKWGQPGSDVDSGESISVGKQMELEAGNAIKYRTCSWPKVFYSSP